MQAYKKAMSQYKQRQAAKRQAQIAMKKRKNERERCA
jgi:hypothetical protein